MHELRVYSSTLVTHLVHVLISWSSSIIIKYYTYIIHYNRARDLRDETFIELFQDEAKRFMGHFIDGTKTNSRKAENLVLLFLSNKHTHTNSLSV